MQIKNETVYVIYFDGKPYEAYGRKLAYISRGAAKGVVTGDMNAMLDRMFQKETGKDYFDNPNAEVWNRLEGELSARFEIVEYGPKRGREEQ